eukprot:1143655-Pelagomonas_calceolata.AAC.22
MPEARSTVLKMLQETGKASKLKVIEVWVECKGSGNDKSLESDERSSMAVRCLAQGALASILLCGFEIIKAVHLDTEPFTVENDMITPSFKLKRPQLLKKYQDALESGMGSSWRVYYVHFALSLIKLFPMNINLRARQLSRYMQKCMARQDASYKWHVQCILVVHTNIAFSGDSVGVECCMLEQLCVCLCSSTAVLACHERAD